MAVLLLFPTRILNPVEGTATSNFNYSRDIVLRSPYPPLFEQVAIVRFLDYADRRIRRYIQSKRQLIKLLEEQKQAVINQAVTMGLGSVSDEDPSVLSAGPAQKLGRLPLASIPWLVSMPDHWRILPSKRLFSSQKQLAVSGDVQLSATQAYGVIPQVEFEEKVGRKVVKVSMHLEKRRHVEMNDFVISMRSFQGGLERAWAAGCIRSSYVVLRGNRYVDVGFFSYLFKSAGYIRALQATSDFIRDGQDLSFSNFCLVDLPVVPLSEQKAIAHFLDQFTARTMSRL